MEIASLFGRCYGNVEGRRLLCLMAGWIMGHIRGIWLPLWFILGCSFTLMKEASPCLWLLPPLHWTRRLKGLLSLVISISSLNFQRKFKGHRMWNQVCSPSDPESADSDCSLYRRVVPRLACRMWPELQNHWRHEEADIDLNTAVQSRKSFSAL